MNLKIKKSFKAKNLRIAVYPDGRVLLIRPYFISEKKALTFLELKKSWLLKNIKKQQLVRNSIKFTRKDYLKNKEFARKIILKKINKFNKFYNFSFERIYIRNQKTRWGSCSSKRNLSFNWKLIKLPKDLADYVVVHELCHLKELNHSHNFWTLVSKAIPNYKGLRKQIRKFGLSLS